MVVLAAQNAFNDKAAQTMLTVLGVFIANAAFRANSTGEMSGEALSTASATASAWIPLAFGALILAPFILLAPVAGWISDRFSKTRVL
ncbi:MAG: acyl-[acyl-carrier-protein]-phospholipid O-acyltransferase, partial [Cryomorphaceae bacterium]